MIKSIVIFYTKVLSELIEKIFHHNHQSRKMGKLDKKLDNKLDQKLDDTEEEEQTNWIEDFDEREKNWR